MFRKQHYIYLTLTFSMVWCMVRAQQEPQYTQYMYNIGSFNPAYVGSVESAEFSGLYRAQWVDIPGAPRNIRFGANIPFSNEKMGLGFNVVSDVLGPSTQTFIDVAYSYQIKMSDDSWLSFGIDAGGSILDLDFSKGNFQNPGEPLIGGENFNQFYPTIGAGLFMYGEQWYAGLSIPNFLTLGIYEAELESVVDNDLQYNIIGGYIFDISDRTKFKPAVLLNYLPGIPVNFNLSANFLFLDALTLGANYRINNSISGVAGLQVSNSIFFGYSYDYNTNGLGEFAGASHEAIVKFYLGRGDGGSKTRNKRNNKLKGKPKQIDSPRFF
ncbi:type IX secretion system membrane protein PorP/SprF [Flavobacteriaceae bacterium GF1]